MVQIMQIMYREDLDKVLKDLDALPGGQLSLGCTCRPNKSSSITYRHGAIVLHCNYCGSAVLHIPVERKPEFLLKETPSIN